MQVRSERVEILRQTLEEFQDYDLGKEGGGGGMMYMVLMKVKYEVNAVLKNYNRRYLVIKNIITTSAIIPFWEENYSKKQKRTYTPSQTHI